MEATSRLVDLDKRFVWHPFTQMQEWCEGQPLMIERGEGNYLVDIEGRRYLDGVSSLWVTVHGHGRQEINQAIVAQLEKIAHSTLLGLANGPAAELAAALVARAPSGLSRVFYSDSGSTAVEIALKQAFQYWQLRGRPSKCRFAHLSEAYHGDTLGAVSVGGISIFHEIFAPLLTASYAIPTPHRYRHPQGASPDAVRDASLAALDALLDAHADELAAVIVEPLVQGAAGMIVHPEGFLRGVAERCRAHDVLLICDEVATGFGRTGTLFACEQEQVTPDFLCLAKGISGGYLPLAATMTTDGVYEAFLGARAELKHFFHGHTYTGNPVACAAGLASLQLFEQDDVLANVKARAGQLAGLLAERVAPLANVGDVRQRGLMVGIELVADKASARAFPYEQFIGSKVCDAIRERGVILRPLGDVLVLMPPLSITAADAELLVGAVAQAIGDVCGV